VSAKLTAFDLLMVFLAVCKERGIEGADMRRAMQSVLAMRSNGNPSD
jgi:hypothetical protein